MLNDSKRAIIAGLGADLQSPTVRRGLKALGVNLPQELDEYLRDLVDSAAAQASRHGADLKHLLPAFAAGSYTPAELDAAIATLDTSRTGVTAQAVLCAWLLGVPLLRDEDRPRAAAALRDVLRKSSKALLMPGEKRAGRAAVWTVGVTIAFAAIGWALGSIIELPGSPSWWDEMVIASPFFAYPVISFCLRQAEMTEAGDLRFIAAHALGRLQAVSAIDALAGACQEGSFYVSRMAKASLRAVLPHLTPEHYGQLGPDIVPNLCRLLKANTAVAFGHEFSQELLTALECVGDARALPTVRQSAQHWTDWTLTDSANRVLKVLEERKRLETDRGTLLRGTRSPVASEEELLRAAANSPADKPEQLLRAVE